MLIVWSRIACSRWDFARLMHDAAAFEFARQRDQIPGHGLGFVLSNGSKPSMWSLPPPMVVYSSHDLYGWNHRAFLASTFTSVPPSL